MGSRLHETIDSVLRCDVTGNTRLTQLALNRRGHDDATTLARDHVLQRATHPPENVIEVPIDFKIPLFVRHLCNWCSHVDSTRVQTANVQLSELFNREINQAFNH